MTLARAVFAYQPDIGKSDKPYNDWLCIVELDRERNLGVCVNTEWVVHKIYVDDITNWNCLIDLDKYMLYFSSCGTVPWT